MAIRPIHRPAHKVIDRGDTALIGADEFVGCLNKVRLQRSNDIWPP